MAREPKAFEAYSIGIVHASICTSLEPDLAVFEMNRLNPSGTTHGWVLSPQAFRNGSPNPSPCEDHPDTHRHYLLEVLMYLAYRIIRTAAKPWGEVRLVSWNRRAPAKKRAK